MPLFKRPDGEFIENLPALRKMIPFVMPGRNESAVFFELQVDLTKTLAYLERENHEHPETPLNLFHLVLFGMLQTFAKREQLNRFVAGNRIYARKNIEISFAIKKQFSDTGALTTTKVVFDPKDTLQGAVARIHSNIKVGRSDAKTQSDTEVDVLTRLPRFALRLIMKIQKFLDGMNLMPAFMIVPDPLYCSMFIANLGSVGLDSAYHHLYEYGTCPFFLTMGKTHKNVVVGDDGLPAVRDVVSLKLTFDERITDGFYCAKSLEIFKKFIEDPQSHPA